LRSAGLCLTAGPFAALFIGSDASGQTPPSFGYTIVAAAPRDQDRGIATVAPATMSLSQTGNIVGRWARYAQSGPSAGQFLGNDAWSYSASTGLQIVSLTGQDYEYSQLGLTYRGGNFVASNDAGQVIG